jgi:uncharacterized membrane protein (UPF0136 family)
VEDRPAELDEREVNVAERRPISNALDRAATPTRLGQFPRRRTATVALFAGLLSCIAAAARATEPGAAVRGKLSLKGKSLRFSHAWLSTAALPGSFSFRMRTRRTMPISTLMPF